MDALSTQNTDLPFLVQQQQAHDALVERERALGQQRREFQHAVAAQRRQLQEAQARCQQAATVAELRVAREEVAAVQEALVLNEKQWGILTERHKVLATELMNTRGAIEATQQRLRILRVEIRQKTERLGQARSGNPHPNYERFLEEVLATPWQNSRNWCPRRRRRPCLRRGDKHSLPWRSRP
jgi:chromosome segregation ATPase